MENEFPPNSHSAKETRAARPQEKDVPEKKAVPRVTKGRAIQRKKSLWKKVVEAFRPEDNKGFAEYVLIDVLVPGIKDNLADSASSAIEHALGVDNPRSRRRRSSGSGYTSYNRMGSARPRDRRDRDDDRRPSRREPATVDHTEIVLDSRVEAEEVIDNMFELLSKYDMVTRRDFLSMVGEPHAFTDEDWGWTDLRGARVHRVREGFLIDLPRPIPLD